MTPHPDNLTSVAMPAAHISAPKLVQWHMIMDNELDMLTDKQTGAMGAIGFTALGGVLGGIIPCVAVVEKINLSPLTISDIIALGVFFCCSSASLICLVSFFWSRKQNKSLKEDIRGRGKPEAPKSPFTQGSFTITTA
ncbi:hypothetical protein A6R70_14395 [Agrobacterium rubi]|uniref:hypothetical protein n=1 Tax=Agrobacterium rubi TaxID=28099 RepID=UPI00201B8E74|nr:hypothetical protein [Agrobacterium rubi]MCL6653479.1 hypothetical protein [Agrobacterium rubi]